MSEVATKTAKTKSLDEINKYLVIRLDGQLFGMRVETIEDILSPQKISPIPLAPPEVVGSLNLRGRVVTVIDLRVKLGMEYNRNDNVPHRSVVVDSKGHLYSFIVDEVSEVMDIDSSKIAHNPENLSEEWQSASSGVFSLDNELMVILDVTKLLADDESENDNDEEIKEE